MDTEKLILDVILEKSASDLTEEEVAFLNAKKTKIEEKLAELPDEEKKEEEGSEEGGGETPSGTPA